MARIGFLVEVTFKIFCAGSEEKLWENRTAVTMIFISLFRITKYYVNSFNMEVQKVDYTRRPFKIAKKDGIFKGCVACSLKDLKEKAIQKLEMNCKVEDVDIYLAEDNTLVDDEDYFATCKANTKLILKKTELFFDDTDGPTKNLERTESQECKNKNIEPAEIYGKLARKNIAEGVLMISSMSVDELDYLTDQTYVNLAKELEIPKDVCEKIIDFANKEQRKRKDLAEATQLLHLFKKSMEHSNDGETLPKRKRVNENHSS